MSLIEASLLPKIKDTASADDRTRQQWAHAHFRIAAHILKEGEEIKEWSQVSKNDSDYVPGAQYRIIHKDGEAEHFYVATKQKNITRRRNEGLIDKGVKTIAARTINENNWKHPSKMARQILENH